MKSSQFLSEDLISDASEAQQDHEVQMARKDCFHAAEDAVALHRLLRNVSETEGLEGWVQSKITLARDYLNKVREHMEYKLIGQEAEISISGDSVEPKLPIAESMNFWQKMISQVSGISDPHKVAKIEDFLRNVYFRGESLGNLGEEALIKGIMTSAKELNLLNETTTAGAVAAVNNPKSKKKSSEVGSLFGGSYQRRISEEVDIAGTEGKSDEERHKAIMKKYPNAKKVGKTPGAYSTTGKGKADLISGIRGVRKISKD